MKTIRVVAAVITDENRIFATARGYGEFKGGWEFPGGKIEPGETPQEALVREIQEELETEISVGELIDTVEYDYPTFHLSMDCFWCTIVHGDLVLKEAEDAKWLTMETIDSVAWLPADKGLVEKIKEGMKKREISLLIGNGFNRLEDPDFPTWDSLIKTPIEDNKDFVDIQNMSYPLKFEYIVNFYNEAEGKYAAATYNEIKNVISKRLNESINRSDKKIDKEIAARLREICPNNVLTTNYDCLLEKVFISKGTNAEYSDNFRTKKENEEYFLSKTRRLGTKNKKTNFYHVHGIDSIPSSICLGYEHYMRIVNQLRNRIIGNKDDIRIIKYLKDKTALGQSFPNEYETKFFDSDVYIMGLGLTSAEVDLWWLLCYRAYLYFANINSAKDLIKNRIVYLDVHPTKITSDGYSYEEDYRKQQEAMFKYMHIEYISCEVRDKNFKQAYLDALDFVPKRC